MAYNFKSLADVELLKATSDGVNLIAEDGGKIVKVAAESLIPENSGGVSSWNDLTDKPFEEKVHREEVLAPTTFTIDETEDEYGSGDGVWRHDFKQNSGHPISEFIGDYVWGDANFGREYVVIYDGIEYVCCVHESDGPALGNSGLWGLSGYGEDVPFLFAHYYSRRDLFTTEPGEHTLAVYTETTEIKTIDPKFLPESVVQVRTISGEDELLIAETSYNFTAVYPNGGTGMPLLTDYEEGLIEGEPYVVVWDGVEYRDVVFNHAINKLQTSTDEFVLQCDYDKSLSVFATSTGIHTITFYKQGEESHEVTPMPYLVLQSTTPGSTKKFKLTVDDSGEPSFEEITD